MRRARAQPQRSRVCGAEQWRVVGVAAGTGDIDRAAAVLRAGGLVAIPTETVYGLGADAEDPAAVARVFQVKGRPPSHPLIVHIAGAERLGDWVADVPDTARLLAERFWPGPLTLVLRRGPRVPLEATGGLETVAVRVPAHPVALALLSAFGGAVAAPSANRFGSVSPTTADHVRAELGDAVDFVLDGGPCQVGVESTIVDATNETPSILRPGGVTREDLEAALGCPVPIGSTSRVRVPGQHPSHYAPRARVVLVDPEKIPAEAEFARELGHRVGVILPPGSAGTAVTAHAVVAVPDSMDAYARGLYGFLRELDRLGCDVIVASLPVEDGLGLAIANRLRRAAGPRPTA
ncbi:L-threonylcarbamoyladenylate synthase [Actinosynnema sp. NPDC051121]|nr:threonylcarbamoyl-AMP synthase [Saccharothrix sp.]